MGGSGGIIITTIKVLFLPPLNKTKYPLSKSETDFRVPAGVCGWDGVYRIGSKFQAFWALQQGYNIKINTLMLF